jgi:hypothetical protein
MVPYGTFGTKVPSLALILTPFLRTPPKAYEELELTVVNLACELAKKGYKITPLLQRKFGH